jgi:hypothetical protein
MAGVKMLDLFKNPLKICLDPLWFGGCGKTTPITLTEIEL